MAKHKNGTVYGKYIKIKSGSGSVKKCVDYIEDSSKTAVPAPSGMDNTSDSIPDISAAIRYVENDLKVFNPASAQHLISGLNCEPETAAMEFQMTERTYHLHKTEKLQPGQVANQAFHIILSYKGTDLPPEMVHMMGCEFARRLLSLEYQAVIATHLNTGNYHNHILVNAYALDGTHKFKDSYHVYKKFREIANEISLEYGLPVMVNHTNTRHMSWKEFMATEEGKSWKKAIEEDLDASVLVSSTYEEVLASMQKKGYDIQKNKRSITFKKDDHQVRDLRLGYRYTAAGIQESLEKQQKRKAQQAIVDQIAEMRKQKKHLKPYPSVHISEYDEYGRRRSFFVRLLLTIRELVKQAGDEYYSEILEQQAPDNPYFMSVSRKLKLLDDALSTIDKYNLTDDDMLQQKLRELFQKNGICRSELYNLTNYLGNAVDLKEAIDRYENLLPILSQANLSLQDLVYVPDTETIRKNLAALNPMRPRTKSDLYQAVHDSPYRLTRKFHTISEEQAKKIILAIREKRTTGLPDGLTMRGRWHKESPELPAPHTPKCDLSSYDADTRQSLLAWKDAADQLAAYGLTTPESVRSFAADIQKKAAMRSDLQNTQAALNAEIRELYRLQHNLERFQKAPFVYGPLYFGSVNFMNKSLGNILKQSNNIGKSLSH